MLFLYIVKYKGTELEPYGVHWEDLDKVSHVLAQSYHAGLDLMIVSYCVRYDKRMLQVSHTFLQ